VVQQEAQRQGVAGYRLVLGTAKQWQVHTVPPRRVVDVDWQWQRQDTVQPLGASVLWRAGTLPQAIRGCESDWPRRSVVVLQAAPSHTPARQLTIQLLDRGSADLVFLGLDWAAHREALLPDPGITGSNQQVLLVLPPGAASPASLWQGNVGVVYSEDWPGLLKGLRFAGVQPVQDVWSTATVQGRVLLRGGPREDTGQRTGITFATVCGGAFTMGSEEFGDAKPPHAVTLSPFEISTTETTNAHYRRWRPEQQGEATLPVANVSWYDARAFCESAGYALPTEAQWEYAARGGSTTRWSFGDDEKQLGDYTWFPGNAGLQTHAVGTRRPNPLGLYDMHGNVWEWVADCYDAQAYAHRAPLVVDPQVGGRCQYRVRRGGSAWNDDARNLRSTNRDRDTPVDRFDLIGVRCVRRPRRQP
jgi:formylglycine-generating enzyme required for sulfatase activity